MRDIKKTVCYQWFHEVWNKGNKEAIDQLMWEHGNARDLPGGDEQGSEGFKKFYDGFTSQFKDIEIDVLDVVSQDDMECAHTMVKAKHIASGKEVNFGGMCRVRIKDGKIEEAWNNYDFNAMENQLA